MAAFIHLYAAGRVDFDLPNGSLQLSIETNYPWDGVIRLTVLAAPSTPATLCVRIPGWCNNWNVRINARPTRELPVPNRGYICTERRWKHGEVLELHLAMPTRRIAAHPAVLHSSGRIALQRGPILYCLEETDNGQHLHDIMLPDDARLTPRIGPGELRNATVVTATALRSRLRPWKGKRYGEVIDERSDMELIAVPYALWGNREPGEMCVWIRRSPAENAAQARESAAG